MADTKISGLTQQTTPTGVSELIINDAGTSKKVSKSDWDKALIVNSITHIANDGSGNVSIPSGELSVGANNDNATIRLKSDDSLSSRIIFGDSSDVDEGRIIYTHGSGTNKMELITNNAVGIEINSSQDVLLPNGDFVFTVGGTRNIGISVPDSSSFDIQDFTGGIDILKGIRSGSRWDIDTAGIFSVASPTLPDGQMILQASTDDSGGSGGIAYVSCGTDNDRTALRLTNGTGNYYIWVDDSGDLRIDSSIPSANNSGTVIGTQT